MKAQTKNKTLKSIILLEAYPSQGQRRDLPEPVSALAVRRENYQIP